MVQRIKELCKDKGITVAELERKCGIGNGIIARWKTSKPSYERLAKVASALETSVEYLQTGEAQKEPPQPEAETVDPLDQEIFDRIKRLSAEDKVKVLEEVIRLELENDKRK